MICLEWLEWSVLVSHTTLLNAESGGPMCFWPTWIIDVI